jgi:hypothetical protein
VDTKTDPPRAIWTHPYEDEQYLREHPDVREKAEGLVRDQGSKDAPSSKSRRHSFNGHDSASMVPDSDRAMPDSTSKKGKEKRGFFGRLKDKAIGTKEEREAYKREMAKVSTKPFAHIFLGFRVSYIPCCLGRKRETAPVRGDG